MAKESLRKAPRQAPAMITTSPSRTRAAIEASEYFRVAVARDFQRSLPSFKLVGAI
jgi:hypothetical protein